MGRACAQGTGRDSDYDFVIMNTNAPDPEGVLKYVTDMSETYIANYRRHLSADQSIYPKDAYSRELFELYARETFCLDFRKDCLIVTIGIVKVLS